MSQPPKKSTQGFADEERAAMKERAKELKAEARAQQDKAAGERDVLAKIGEMPEPDRAMAERLRELVTKGALNGLVFNTDDVRGLYETLKARGVTDFTQEPTDHFYGTDMGVRDPFGNAIRVLQPSKVEQEATT